MKLRYWREDTEQNRQLKKVLQKVMAGNEELKRHLEQITADSEQQKQYLEQLKAENANLKLARATEMAGSRD